MGAIQSRIVWSRENNGSRTQEHKEEQPELLVLERVAA
jgi:hypothetical protein